MGREIFIIDDQKNCSKCRTLKHVSCFGSTKTTKNGLRSDCFDCRKAIYQSVPLEIRTQPFKDHYEKNKDVINARRTTPEAREKARQYYANNAESLRERNRKYSYPELRKKTKERNKHKIQARKKLNRAIARGQFERPKICETCGSDKRIEAHHHDYSKAYEVQWLCGICHNKRHLKR